MPNNRDSRVLASGNGVGLSTLNLSVYVRFAGGKASPGLDFHFIFILEGRGTTRRGERGAVFTRSHRDTDPSGSRGWYYLTSGSVDPVNAVNRS